MDKKLEKLINEQIKEEIYSAYIYLAMSAFCKGKNWNGIANWFEIQYKEEMDHAMGFYTYLFERDGQVELESIPKPPTEYKGLKDLFDETLKHEQYITSKIGDLYKLAVELNDFSAQSFLKWYIDEQVEEESNAKDLIEKLKLVGEKGEAIYWLDKDLSARVYTLGGPYIKAL